jgi:catalase
LPEPLPPARPPIRDLASSPALSIIANGPQSFAGRKIGALLTDGVDAALIADLRAATAQEKVNLEFIAPTVGGVDASDGSRIVADQKLDGGPSVLYDAVVVLTTKEGASMLAQYPAARDFVTDAYAHCKFIGYVEEATTLFRATGVSEMLDAGFVRLDNNRSAADFLATCRQLRFWERQLTPA